MAPLVKIENVSLFIPGDRKRDLALRGISWNINRHAAIFGPNGAGKSTLLKLIHGDLWPASGHIFWRDGAVYNESPITGKSISALVSPAIQENWQKFPLHITVAKLLEEQSDQDYVHCILEKLDLLPLLGSTIPTLSQGQLRLALLARAILSRPKLLLLDECGDGLDKRHRELFFRLLDEESKKMLVVFTTHRLQNLPDWCKEIVHLEDGKLLPESRQEIFTICKSCKRAPESKPVPAGQTPLFKLDDVSVYIDRKLVLKNITWQMRQGENWSISGANGSGKSTFLRLLAGDEFAAAGGQFQRWSPKLRRVPETLEDVRKSFVLVSDLSQALYGYDLSGLELVCSGYDNSIGLYRDFTEAEKTNAMTAIEKFFPPSINLATTSIRRLSSGQLRSLFLIRALMAQPDVLLLDEPCTGLDPEARDMYLKMLDDLANFGFRGIRPQIVFVTHYEEDIPACVTHCASFEDGRLL